ncbi:MAG: HIT family protein [Planctomycetota bacterium]|jgi:histidine triad (HIT) family protein
MPEEAPKCVFCEIAAGRMPGEFVLQGEKIVAILDIHPIAPGHTLVLPRAHHEQFTDLPSDLAVELTWSTQEVAKMVVKATKAEGWNLLACNHPCAGQSVPHAHLHVIPRKADDGIRFNWSPAAYDEAAIAKMGRLIRGEEAPTDRIDTPPAEEKK